MILYVIIEYYGIQSVSSSVKEIGVFKENAMGASQLGAEYKCLRE